MAGQDPSKLVAQIYEAADAVKEAYRLLNRLPFHKRPALDTLLDGRVYPGDFDVLAQSLTAIADDWQGELDAEP